MIFHKMKGAATLVYISCALLTGSLIHSSSIEVVFYNIDMKEWNEQEGTSTFKDTIADNANTYCQLNLDSCGLINWITLTPFTSAEVKILDGFPAKAKSNIVVKFSIMYISQMNISDVTQTELSSAALRDIAVASRDALRSTIGSWIIYIDEEHHSPPPPRRANEILIPIGFAVVLAFIVLSLGLYYWRKKKNSEERRLAKKDRNKNKVSPSHQPPPYNGHTRDLKPHEMVYPPSRKPGYTPKTDSPADNMTKGGNDRLESVDERKRRHKRRHHKKKKQDGPELGVDGTEASPYMYERYTGSDNGYAVEYKGQRDGENEDTGTNTQTTEL